MKQPANASFICRVRQAETHMGEQERMEDAAAAVAAAVGMEVDDADPVDILADFDRQQPPVDPDFFNSFADDFDDDDLD